jgi:2-octaprenyl-6-methoxyphenol hydroxylase
MTVRDIKILLDIIKKRVDVGLSLDSSVSLEFQNKIKHKNFIFSNGVDLIHELFEFERKMKTSFLSKSVKLISNYPTINKIFTKIADKGILL